MNAMGRSIEKLLAVHHQRFCRGLCSLACAVLALAVVACGDDGESGDGAGPSASEADTSVTAVGEALDQVLSKDEAAAEQGSTPAAGRRDVVLADTGSITGLVVFKGSAPAPEPLSVFGDAFCMGLSQEGEGLFSESLVVSDGRLANAFVWISEGMDNWRFERAGGSVDLDQVGCAYTPHVLGLRKGETLRVANSDPVLHNVHSVGDRNGEKNLAMPLQGQVVEMKFKRAETMVTVNCDVHAWMKCYIGVVDHPCFDVSASDGSFTLGSVPPGDYVVSLWHETLGVSEVQVTVLAQQTVGLGELSF